jgi:uncharacterized protein (DUF342 family)
VIWSLRDGRVWLAVSPDEDLTLDDIEAEAHLSGYLELDTEVVAEVLVDGKERPVAVVDAARRTGAVAVTVDDDGMAAQVRVHPGGPLAPPLTLDDVRAALDAAGVTHGVDEKALTAVALDKPGTHEVAHGEDPRPGRDGELHYLVEPTHSVRPVPREDGGVDLRAEATLPKVDAGEELAEIVPPEPGRSGWTVRGEELLARPGRHPHLPQHKNVELNEEGTRLVAAIDGLLELTPGRVVVRPDLTVPGDVDFKSGSIDFHGDVVVQGSVRPGFRVKAGGRVVVQGDVDQAEVEAESLVWIRGAAVGADCVIRSRGDVKVRTVKEARVEARGSIFVEREAMDATLLASKDLIFESPRNRLVGGLVVAGREVVAGEIGTVAEVPTRVQVGTDPLIAEEEATLDAERTELQGVIDRLGPTVRPLLEDPTAIDRLGADRRPAAERLIAAYTESDTRLAEVAARIEELHADDDPDAQPRIVVRLALRPGVTLVVGRGRRVVDVPRFRVVAIDVAGGVELIPLERDAATSVRTRKA